MTTGVPPEIDGLSYVQPLGSGGYADVYLYEQDWPRMRVAVKVLKSEGLTPAIRRQFMDEANTMAHLADHPYIVQVFRAGTSDDGRPYLVMKYYPPPNLAQRARSERFTVEAVLRTGVQVASAVETAHRAGIIHRDIKPANVLVSQYGSPGLTDFGIAGRGAALEEELADEVGVSVPWAPPEVLFGQSNGDARADVYSLAATLWQLLVGRSPFEVPGGENTAYALMPRIRSTQPPATGRPDVPTSLERLLQQAMSKSPAARPATAMALARALQQVEQEQRFPRTNLVVLDEQGQSAPGGSGGTPADQDERTQVRSPQNVRGAQAPPPPPRPQPAQWAHDSANRRHLEPAEDDLADEGTVQVNRARAPEQPEAAPPPETSGTLHISGSVIVAAVGVVFALAAALGWAVTRDGGTPAPDTTSPTTVASGGDTQPIVILDRPTISAAPVEGGVKFTWEHAGAQPGDAYGFRSAKGEDGALGDAQVVTTKQRSKVVEGKKGTKVCAQVQLRRNGTQTAYSDAACDRVR